MPATSRTTSQRFDVTLSVMQTEEALERIAYELAEDAAADGVRYIEMRYAPMLNVVHGLTLVQAVEAPLRGLRRAEKDYGIIGRFIVCALRAFTPEESLELAQLAVAFKNDGVVASTSPAERRDTPRPVTPRRSDTRASTTSPCTCHAGEGDGAESVREAVHVCGAHRIGHAHPPHRGSRRSPTT